MGIDFNSSSTAEGVNYGYPSHLDNMDPLSVSAWIYPIDWGESSFGRIVCKEGSSTGWLFFVDDAVIYHGLSFLRNRQTTNSESRSQDSAISLNEWAHVGFTYRASDGAVLYKNGVEISRQLYNAGSGSNIADNSAYLYVGNRTGYSRGFRGYVEGVRIWERYLSAAEMWNTYSARGRDKVHDAIFASPMKDGIPDTYVGSDSGVVKDTTYHHADGTSLYSLTSWREGVTATRRGGA